jgi:opacity protein-like surface antigen
MYITQRLRWISLLGASVLALAASAHAAGLKNFYFAGYMGLNTPKKSFEAPPEERSGAFTGSLGLKLSPQWRIETEFTSGNESMNRINFNQTDAPSDPRFKGWSGLVTIFHDFEGPGKIEPFVGVGVGYSSKNIPSGDSGGTFAWQIGGGLKYDFNPALSFSSAYRFYNEGADTSLDSTVEDGQEFRVGVTYKLPVRKKNHARGLNDPAFNR